MAGRTETKYFDANKIKKFKTITPVIIKKVESSVKVLLHASRDCLRNQDKDTSIIMFSCTDGYYSEAFGIMRGLEILGYGRLSSVNLNGFEDDATRCYAKQAEHNLRWWMYQLEEEVLEEENYNGDGHCDYCKEHYHKDTKTVLERKVKK